MTATSMALLETNEDTALLLSEPLLRGRGGSARRSCPLLQVLADEQVELLPGSGRDQLGRRVDGELDRVPAGAVPPVIQGAHRMPDDRLRGRDVAPDIAQYLIERHVL